MIPLFGPSGESGIFDLRFKSLNSETQRSIIHCLSSTFFPFLGVCLVCVSGISTYQHYLVVLHHANHILHVWISSSSYYHLMIIICKDDVDDDGDDDDDDDGGWLDESVEVGRD